MWGHCCGVTVVGSQNGVTEWGHCCGVIVGSQNGVTVVGWLGFPFGTPPPPGAVRSPVLFPTHHRHSCDPFGAVAPPAAPPRPHSPPISPRDAPLPPPLPRNPPRCQRDDPGDGAPQRPGPGPAQTDPHVLHCRAALRPGAALPALPLRGGPRALRAGQAAPPLRDAGEGGGDPHKGTPLPDPMWGWGPPWLRRWEVGTS